MPLTLASRAIFDAALRTGRDIALCAYTLSASGPVARALEAAADRGARVTVRLDGHPAFGHARPGLGPAATIDALTAHGVRVDITRPGDPPAHLKAAVVDGVAYLDDRNWAARGDETIVRDASVADVAAIGRAIAGLPAAADGVALEKSDALAREVAMIAAAPGDRIDVATESFGGSVVSAALAARARAGTHVRLAVDARALVADGTGRERTLLAHLAAAGVAVRAVASDSKVAICGDRAWIGSANATYALGPMSDWGGTTFDRDDVRRLEETFERAWQGGTPVTGAATPSASVERSRSSTTSPAGALA
ncbi:MAG: hypothetical protein NVS3B17_14850 [Vulcanimicrobiaceae bacterium]